MPLPRISNMFPELSTSNKKITNIRSLAKRGEKKGERERIVTLQVESNRFESNPLKSKASWVEWDKRKEPRGETVYIVRYIVGLSSPGGPLPVPDDSIVRRSCSTSSREDSLEPCVLRVLV